MTDQYEWSRAPVVLVSRYCRSSRVGWLINMNEAVRQWCYFLCSKMEKLVKTDSLIWTSLCFYMNACFAWCSDNAQHTFNSLSPSTVFEHQTLTHNFHSAWVVCHQQGFHKEYLALRFFCFKNLSQKTFHTCIAAWFIKEPITCDDSNTVGCPLSCCLHCRKLGAILTLYPAT